MHITYLVHGFPPFEKAGTEQHTAILAQEMLRLGHRVTIISATRRPGALHGDIHSHTWNGLSVHRIVNNIATLPLRDGERRPEIEAIIERLIPTSTDILHIQHTQFLSSKIKFDGPKIWTIHDAWGWCPAGGTLIRNGKPCHQPTAMDCVQCYSKWRPVLSLQGQQLLRFGRILSKLSRFNSAFEPQNLHRQWQKFPTHLRNRITSSSSPNVPEPTENLLHRNRQFEKLAMECSAIVSPSRYLAHQASVQGWKNLRVIEHGIQQTPLWGQHIGGDGFVFIGSMVKHKGPHIVESAYHSAFPNAKVPIRFIGSGPVQVTLPHQSAVSNAEVYRILQTADALVMGSIWHENYPMILLEAKAVGCPIIAPNCGGIPEIVKDGVDGMLYEMGNVEALAEALATFNDTKKTTWKVERPKSSPTMATEYVQLYESACTNDTNNRTK